MFSSYSHIPTSFIKFYQLMCALEVLEWWCAALNRRERSGGHVKQKKYCWCLPHIVLKHAKPMQHVLAQCPRQHGNENQLQLSNP